MVKTTVELTSVELFTDCVCFDSSGGRGRGGRGKKNQQEEPCDEEEMWTRNFKPVWLCD